jgi:catechol 2,3-dioxygenase-like lactoylglutathione lyase family enzyme
MNWKGFGSFEATPHNILTQTMLKKVVPMFHVPDVQQTVDWYRAIGFDVTATYDDNSGGLSFAIVSFGASEVMFNSGGRLSSQHRREVDNLYDQIKERVEIVEGPHNMFYGMREIIIRDLNGFWITFGQQIPPEVLTPWPAVDTELLHPYTGRYESDNGSGVLITIHEGRLMAFPEDAPGVFLRPAGEHTFTPMMTEEARVVFEAGAGLMAALMFEQCGRVMRFVRVP